MKQRHMLWVYSTTHRCAWHPPSRV